MQGRPACLSTAPGPGQLVGLSSACVISVRQMACQDHTARRHYYTCNAFLARGATRRARAVPWSQTSAHNHQQVKFEVSGMKGGEESALSSRISWTRPELPARHEWLRHTAAQGDVRTRARWTLLSNHDATDMRRARGGEEDRAGRLAYTHFCAAEAMCRCPPPRRCRCWCSGCHGGHGEERKTRCVRSCVTCQTVKPTRRAPAAGPTATTDSARRTRRAGGWARCAASGAPAPAAAAAAARRPLRPRPAR